MSYYYYIEPLLRNIPYNKKYYGFDFNDYKRISKAIGNPYDVSFYQKMYKKYISTWFYNVIVRKSFGCCVFSVINWLYYELLLLLLFTFLV